MGGAQGKEVVNDPTAEERGSCIKPATSGSKVETECCLTSVKEVQVSMSSDNPPQSADQEENDRTLDLTSQLLSIHLPFDCFNPLRENICMGFAFDLSSCMDDVSMLAYLIKILVQNIKQSQICTHMLSNNPLSAEQQTCLPIMWLLYDDGLVPLTAPAS